MKITHTKEEITFTFPRWGKRHNPYMDEEEEKFLDPYPTFTGLIIRNRKGGNFYDDIGFAGTIDMDYKGKPDQVSDFIIKWHESEEEFVEKCKELGISIHEIEV